MKNETTANLALSHAAELRAINNATTVRVGANFAKPIPRKVQEAKGGDFISRLIKFGKRHSMK